MPGRALDELAAALRHLHRQAGEPSARRIGLAIHCSHTTVSKILKCANAPGWDMLERVVRHLGGDPVQFKKLWVAVRDDDDRAAAIGDQVDPDGAGVATSVSQAVFTPPATVVLRWEAADGTYEFFSEQLALLWMRIRQGTGELEAHGERVEDE